MLLEHSRLRVESDGEELERMDLFFVCFLRGGCLR